MRSPNAEWGKGIDKAEAGFRDFHTGLAGSGGEGHED